jgi:TatD DNase family protein
VSAEVIDMGDGALRWADSHCHVYDERIPDGSSAALDLARADGVDTFIVVGCDRATTRSALEIAAAHRDVWATVGLHPHEASHGVETVVDLLDAPGVVAVGEAGLDFHYDHSPRETQAEAFRAQIDWANERSLPLVIHTREAWEETFAILDEAGMPERTVFHCFTGGVHELDACVERGAMVSFSGIVTFASATDLREAAVRCPLDSMLIETDSPYLAPVPHRGRPNQPALVAAVGTAIADLRDIAPAEVATATRANTRRFFDLDDRESRWPS